MFSDVRYYTDVIIVILILTTGFVIGCERIPTDIITVTPVDKIAVANISAIDGSSLIGTAVFTETNSGVHVVIEIQDAPPGLHAAHLHIGSSCADVGTHWHPMDVPAGTAGVPVTKATLGTPPIGVGEIGNISVGEDGMGILEFTTPFWSVGGDPNTDILGKLILIHETGDTFQTNPHAHLAMPNAGTHSHMVQIQTGTEMTQVTHVCTLAVLGQQIDLEADHHLPGQAVSPHSHDLLELLLTCFVSAEQLVDPRTLSVIPLKDSPTYQTFLGIEPKSLAAYHEFFIFIGLPVDPNFFTNQYKQTFPTGTPEKFEQEMQKRLTHLYITSGIDLENLTDTVGYNMLLTRFLNDQTTAWVLGYFQGDDVAFGEWIVSVLEAVQVRPGGGSRIGCGVIGLME